MPPFDEPAVLHAALTVFRKEGFHACRPESLAIATGVPWDDLLARYGDKEGVFYAALEQAQAEGQPLEASELAEMARKIDRMASMPRMRLVHKRARTGIGALTDASQIRRP